MITQKKCMTPYNKAPQTKGFVMGLKMAFLEKPPILRLKC